jgi:hypothetical protein
MTNKIPRQQRLDSIIDYLRKNPNSPSQEIAKAIGVSNITVKEYLTNLRLFKKVYVSGQKSVIGGSAMLFSLGNNQDVEYKQNIRNVKYKRDTSIKIEKILAMCEFEAKSIRDISNAIGDSYYSIDHVMRRLHFAKMVYIARYVKNKKYFKTGSKQDAPAPVYDNKKYMKEYNKEYYRKKKEAKLLENCKEDDNFKVIKSSHDVPDTKAKPDLAASWLFTKVEKK